MRKGEMDKMKIKCIIAMIVILTMVTIAFYRTDNTYQLKYNSIIEKQISPDGNYEAIKFLRSINSTTRDSYHLSIVDKNSSLSDKSGNIYISYDDFEYAWEGNSVIVTINDEDVIFKNETKWNHISVKYFVNN